MFRVPTCDSCEPREAVQPAVAANKRLPSLRSVWQSQLNAGTLGGQLSGNPWQIVPEQEYLAYLEHERHMFAWCLVE
jgi:hypothetical protein